MSASDTVFPVHFIPTDAPVDNPAEGMGLCLSGGGFRAMLFHAGALWRLNEFGMLPRFKRISSVSGGSITNGVLGLAWNELAFDAAGISPVFSEKIIEPLRAFAERTFDWKAVAKGLFLPGSAGDQMVDFYREHLFANATLQSLPDDSAGEGPRFVFNATNMQSGVLWRFSRPYMADYRVGSMLDPTTEIAVAVAASAGFPPLLSPVTLNLKDGALTEEPGNDLHKPPFTTHIDLADGGIYDNLGLETVWKRYRTVLVSDGGGHLGAQPDPPDDWVHQVRRVLSVIDSQVRSLRKRLIIDAYKRPAGASGARDGSYWGIWGDIADFGLPDSLPCDLAATTRLAETPTRLAKLEPEQQERLINWGYAVCDASVRRFFDTSLPAPAGFPFPSSGVG